VPLIKADDDVEGEGTDDEENDAEDELDRDVRPDPVTETERSALDETDRVVVLLVEIVDDTEGESEWEPLMLTDAVDDADDDAECDEEWLVDCVNVEELDCVIGSETEMVVSTEAEGTMEALVLNDGECESDRETVPESLNEGERVLLCVTVGETVVVIVADIDGLDVVEELYVCDTVGVPVAEAHALIEFVAV
jgi:hypothetical protein